MGVQYRNSRVDVPLTNVSLDYRPEGFIADMALTPLAVGKWSGFLAEYGTAHLQLLSTRVMDRGQYHTVPSVDRKIEKTYKVENHGVRDFVTERDREEVEQPFEARADVTMGLTNLLKIEKEFLNTNLLNTTANFASGNSATLTGQALWSDYTNSDPLKNIREAINKIFVESKKVANSAIVPFQVLQVLRYHPKLTGIYGYTGKFESISVDQIKAIFGIQNLYVPTAAYVNAAGSETLFWGKECLIYHKDASAMKHQRTLGFCVKKRGHENRVFSKDAADMVNSEMILHDMAYDFMLTHTGAGYLFKAAIA